MLASAEISTKMSGVTIIQKKIISVLHKKKMKFLAHKFLVSSMMYML